MRDYYRRVETILSSRRWEHTLGVIAAAKKLATINEVDPEQAELASLLHDWAREREDLYFLAQAHGLITDPVEKSLPDLLHAPVASWLARHELGVDDQQVLQAVARHTIGAPGMTRLDAVVFVADMLEPGRKFSGIEELRRLADDNLQLALLQCMDRTLEHVIAQHRLIHPQTVAARNYLLLHQGMTNGN